ncbi:MAG: SPFH domain-containing protein [Gammaproteobacteria bacterium]|nr:SPFH domain-containing protein [Gammaproteobacteria bacterium]
MLRYYKGNPATYTVAFRNGKAVKHGAGINFWYTPFNTSIAEVPAVSQEANFIFKETTSNFQEIAIQGALTYRVTDPLTIVQLLDFTDEGGAASEQLETLVTRVINAVQFHTRDHIARLTLEQALDKARSVARDVFETVSTEPNLVALGVEIESLYFTDVAATPEMRKALEADYRESLKGRADHAIYTRRAAAVAEERKIRESEMNTEIELEDRRRELVERQAENNLTLAEADAKADEMKLNPYGNLPPQALVGLALKEWAGQAGTIGSLNISPDLLGKVVSWIDHQKEPREEAGAE